MSRKPQQPDADFIALQEAVAGEYSLDREIGRGGMGIVYLAHEVSLARHVAIKVLPPALAARDELRSAFLRESQTVARLNHPNIVPVYAAGERGGFVYIVMAYVEGITLGERIRTRGPLLPGQAARLLREVSWALAYAHAAGIVHRDVTAENILLERGTDRAIVMDFGIASAMQSAAISDDGRVMGNAHYVSPEQAVGERVDARSDLYSLGVCGFYALTGQLPFDAETPAEVVTMHLTVTPPPIASLAPAVPARLGQAVDRCLAKEPLRRYRNAESFAEAIDLAFEHAKEIPAPLRVWIGRGERELPARLTIVGMSALLGVALVTASMHTWAFFVPVGIATTMSVLPVLLRLRRVLKDGYHVDDLAAALREHRLLRSEEIAYELSQRSPLAHRIMQVTLGVTVAGIPLFGFLTRLLENGSLGGRDVVKEAWLYGGMFICLGVGLVSAVGLGGNYLRQKLSARMSSATISFWNGKWGKRLAQVAGLGLEPADRPAVGMPLLTEVALGRATDHLFQALPKARRRELAALPATVRRLEEDAAKLRAVIDAFDDQLAMFGRDADSGTKRDDVERDLRASRTLSAERLAATVAALENIRLDLLRLQMGSAGIESVTASLEAAQRVGEQIAFAVEAQSDVELLLADARLRPHDAHRPTDAETNEGEVADDDADTPVGGVPATRG